MQSSPPRLLIAAALTVVLTASSARAASDVRVLLQDPSTGGGVTKMQILAEPNRAAAGQVTFDVTNDSKTLVHEMLLMRKPRAGARLPYNAKDQRVIEAKTVKLVDTDDIRPGASVRKTVTLRPGSYEIICNQPGHYAQGMTADFMVTR